MSEEENEILRREFPERGTNISELKHKSARTINRQAHYLGLINNPHKRMSEEDKQLIIKYFPIEGAKCVTRLSVSRSATYLSKVARKLGLSYEAGRKVRCIETGKEYLSAANAGREVGVKGSRILGCASGKEGHITAGGYHWEFV